MHPKQKKTVSGISRINVENCGGIGSVDTATIFLDIVPLTAYTIY